MNDDGLTLLLDRYDDEFLDRLEHRCGAAHEWDDEQPYPVPLPEVTTKCAR